jgi:FPC/CPF motif-containing protein YcgG
MDALQHARVVTPRIGADTRVTPRAPLNLDLLQCAWLAPFDDDTAKAHSQYCAFHDGELLRLLETAEPTPFARVSHDAFRSFVLSNDYPCLGARAALHRNTYRFGAYERLDDAEVTRGLMRDLYAFVAERQGIAPMFSTFIAIVREMPADGEPGFERALWSQLQRLRDVDREYHEWDPAVSADPADPNFSFSLAGNAFFVVGLNPSATRDARRFSWPTLVFNAHQQFEDLKADGSFKGLQAQIRNRDIALQGSINPNLADFGHHSEARQYSGRETEADWKCPFHAN